MANHTADELRRRMDAAWQHLTGQLHGMEPHLDSADAPGEWTVRVTEQVSGSESEQKLVVQ